MFNGPPQIQGIGCSRANEDHPGSVGYRAGLLHCSFASMYDRSDRLTKRPKSNEVLGKVAAVSGMAA